MFSSGMGTLVLPPGWTSQQLLNLTIEQFSQLSDDERNQLKSAAGSDPWSPEYRKIGELNIALQQMNQRPLTPPSYIPPGWTEQQARAAIPSFELLAKLSPEEERLWAAGTAADSTRQAKKNGTLRSTPPSFIPSGWTAQQAVCPTFDILSALSKEDLTRFLQSQNEAASLPTSSQPASALSAEEPAANLSPLVQTLHDAGFPPWGFVIVRTDYASEQLWETFQERVLDEMCEAQLDEETGDQAELKRMRDTLQFKAIEDPRLESVGFDEVRKHFHIAKELGGIAAGLDLSVCLVADTGSMGSVLNGREGEVPYVIAVDVTGAAKGANGYPGYFKVAVDSLLCEFYPKISMGLAPSALWAMMDEADGVWNGDE